MMVALHFNDQLKLLEKDNPKAASGDVLIRVASAGICNTDIEITRGYISGFNGTPGHEFIGYVESVYDSSLDHLLEKRVTAEINCGCGTCIPCREGFERHCASRSVLGIIDRDGAFAEYISVPSVNVVEIPENISNDTALFIEPLAAALEIQEQVTISPDDRVLLIGDGKLAHLIARTLQPLGCELLVLGKHAWKVNLLSRFGVTTVCDPDIAAMNRYDIVIEASGSPEAFRMGLGLVRPRGTLVLKSTYANCFSFNPSAMVVNEITIVGSRCGRFSSAIVFLNNNQVDLSYLISKRFPLSDGIAAFAAAEKSDVLKVVIDCTV